MLELINQYGYWAVFLLIFIEGTIFPPIPSEMILSFAGFMTTYSDMKVLVVIAVSTLGTIVSSFALYALGRFLRADRLEKLFDGRLARILHLKREDFLRAQGWFLRHENKAVFLCRFVPIVRSLISIPAGMAKMNFAVFTALSLLGNLIWNSVLIYFGVFFGDAWEVVIEYMNIYSLVVIGVFAVIALIIAVIFIKRRFLNKSDDNSKGKNLSDEDK